MPSLATPHPGLVGKRRLHALVTDEPGIALDAVRKLRTAGFTVADVFTPFPIHGMPEAMGLAETRIPYATLVGAAVGLSVALGFQIWTHAIDWPLVIGGKSNLALPALAPVAFELAVLFAAFATVGSFLFRRRLYPRADAPNQPLPEVTDDRFVIVVEEADASFSARRFRAVAEGAGIVEIIESWRVY